MAFSKGLAPKPGSTPWSFLGAFSKGHPASLILVNGRGSMTSDSIAAVHEAEVESRIQLSAAGWDWGPKPSLRVTDEEERDEGLKRRQKTRKG